MSYIDTTRLYKGETLEYKARVGFLHRVSYDHSIGRLRIELLNKHDEVVYQNDITLLYELKTLMGGYAPIKLWEWKPKQEVKT